jgi:hypothetical protein
MIRSLLGDSSELSSLKGKLIQQQRANAQAQAKAGSGSQAQTPLTQGPLTQAPLTQDKTGVAAQSSRNAGKVQKTMPPKPPLGISDIVDGRRIVKTI